MGLIDFVKSAGEKLFGRGKTQTAMAEMQAAPADPAKVAAANAAAGDAILDYIKGQNLSATGLTVTFDGATSIGHRVRRCRRPGDQGEDHPLLRQRRGRRQGQRHDDGVGQRAAGASTTRSFPATRCRRSASSTTAMPTST